MMEDAPELEPFEISENDLEAAWSIGGSRPQITKDQQLYGVWADSDESDDDSSRSGLGRKKKKSRQAVDYTAGVSFVSGGIKTGDKIQKADDDEDEPVDSEDEIDQMDQLQRLAFASGSKKKKLPIYSGRGKQRGGSMRNDMISGMRGHATDPKKFADWEKHTKGVGSKIMQQLGFERGKGLGKHGKGITAPVEASVRPGRGAVGAYGREANRPKKAKDGGDVGSGESESSENDDAGGSSGDRKAGSWRKGEKKPKAKYKTLEEIVEEGGSLRSRLGGLVGSQSSKVIDLTGKEQKIYSGYDAFGLKTTRVPGQSGMIGKKRASGNRKFYDIPELVYNLDLLIEMTEEEIVRNDRQLKYMKDQNTALEHEESQLSESIEAEAKQTKRVEELMALVDKYSEMEANNELTLEECKVMFHTFQQDYYTEYKMLGLANLAQTTVLPKTKTFFENWDPLADPEKGCEMLREWRHLLEEGGDWSMPQLPNAMDSYHRIIWEAVVPHMRNVIMNQWKPRDSDALLTLLESWQPVIPQWIFINLLDQLILPRLQAEVNDWNPCADHVPIHSWLHPWLPMMGDRLQVLWGPIRQKLGRALNEGPGWHPSDKSAKSILQPWVGVFSKGSMENFVSRHILPRLELCIQTWDINPGNQDLRPWEWLMNWLDMASPTLIATILVQNFFPRWHKALVTWLSCPNPNYTEITHWYSGWKSMFPVELSDLPVIKEQFHRALEMMNRAVSDGHAPKGAREEVAYLSVNERMKQMEVAAQQHKKDMETIASSAGPTSFKELVEKRAEENSLAFMPVPNRYREGKQVYKFGSKLIYLDRTVVFVQKDSSTTTWEPISLDILVNRANNDV